MPTLVSGPETLVNTATFHDQAFPAIAALKDGRWVVTWYSYGQDGSAGGIYQQAYNADGTKHGIEILVNTETTDNQAHPAITALADGGWLVSWASWNQDGSGTGVYQQVYNPDGSKKGLQTLVNTQTASDQYVPSITTLTNGGWVVTWSDYGQDGSSWGIYQQAFNADGSKQGIETRVNTETASVQNASAVTALANGGWVVTWDSYGQDGSEGGIYQQVYNADGSKDGIETRVNTYTAYGQTNAAIATLADGGWVVTWQSEGQDGSTLGIFQQAYNADGSKRDGESLVNTETYSGQYQPAITALADGGWVVTWASTDQDSGSAGVYQQAYNADGSRQGIEIRVNTEAASIQERPAITALPDGGWVVTWESYAQDGSSWGIYQKVFHLEDVDPVGTPNGVLADGIEDTAYTGTLDTLLTGIIDRDGGALSVTAISADHGTVSIDVVAGTFTVTPDNDYSGTVTLTYTVDDDNGGSKSGFKQTFDLTAVNDAPTVANPISDQTLQYGEVLNFAFANNAFADIDSPSLTYTATLANGNPLPAWLQFDGTTRTFSGSPTMSGVVAVMVIASDGTDFASDVFTITTTAPPSPPTGPTNRAPTLSAPNADTSVQVGQSMNLIIGDGHFTDSDAGTDLDYTITVDGSATIPTWLTFDAETGLLIANPTTADSGNHVITVTASDGSLSSTADEFNLIVTSPAAPLNLRGTKGNDNLIGNAGDDMINGRKGNDKLTGNDGADTFRFSQGRDQVLDFDSSEGDVIDLSSAQGIRNFNDLLANHVVDTDAGLKIVDKNGNSLFLKGDIDVEDLSADMFLF